MVSVRHLADGFVARGEVCDQRLVGVRIALREIAHGHGEGPDTGVMDFEQRGEVGGAGQGMGRTALQTCFVLAGEFVEMGGLAGRYRVVGAPSRVSGRR